MITKPEQDALLAVLLRMNMGWKADNAIAALRKLWSEPVAMCECGHLRGSHIYEEGACRGGSVCLCAQFNPSNTPGLPDGSEKP